MSAVTIGLTSLRDTAHLTTVLALIFTNATLAFYEIVRLGITNRRTACTDALVSSLGCLIFGMFANVLFSTAEALVGVRVEVVRLVGYNGSFTAIVI
jgi:hypothetical protein